MLGASEPHVRTEDLTIVAPPRLGLVHGLIGVREEGAGVDALLGIQADADADGHREGMRRDHLGAAHAGDHLLGDKVAVHGMLKNFPTKG